MSTRAGEGVGFIWRDGIFTPVGDGKHVFTTIRMNNTRGIAMSGGSFAEIYGCFRLYRAMRGTRLLRNRRRFYSHATV